MKLLPGLLLLLGAHTALGADIQADRRVLLADMPLAALRERSEFTNAVHASESGDGATARRELLALTTSGETHVRLLAWNVLRTLGVEPAAEAARIVRASPVANDRVRLTMLTYAGYYVIDTHSSALAEEHPAHAAIAAAREIVRHYDSTDH